MRVVIGSGMSMMRDGVAGAAAASSCKELSFDKKSRLSMEEQSVTGEVVG